MALDSSYCMYNSSNMLNFCCNTDYGSCASASVYAALDLYLDLVLQRAQMYHNPVVLAWILPEAIEDSASEAQE